MSLHLRHHRSGNNDFWRFRKGPQDASQRLRIHGPVQGMEQPGFLAKLFGRFG
jgi:hypothetical protein